MSESIKIVKEFGIDWIRPVDKSIVGKVDVNPMNFLKSLGISDIREVVLE